MADAHDLYGLPLERFVSERAALARSLRANGQRDEAARVAKLRKPSVAAWAVNQLVRTQGAAVRELFEAGDALQRAHADLLGGRGNPADLREAADRERTAVEQLSTTARGLLTSEGHELSGTMLERVAETLHAAALDPDARGEVADGCLERELRHVGLGSASLSPAAPSGRTKPGKRTKPDKRADRKRDERLKEARRAAGDARRAAERAVRALRSAEERRDRAIAALDDAEAQVSDARKAVEEAERVRESSERALAELSG